MKKLTLLVFAFLLAFNYSWGQSLSKERAEVKEGLLDKALHTQRTSVLKTSGTACIDTVNYTMSKGFGVLAGTHDLGYVVGFQFPPGQVFGGGDSITLTGVRVLVAAKSGGLGTLYNAGDTLSFYVQVRAISDTTGGVLNLGPVIDSALTHYVVVVNQSGAPLGDWAYGTFTQPVDLSANTLYAFTVSKLGGKNDSLSAFINETIDNQNPNSSQTSPVPVGGLVHFGGAWQFTYAINPAFLWDFLFNPIVEHNLYTDFALVDDTVNSGDTVKPINKSHKAYLSHEYNLSAFTDYYWNSLNLANWKDLQNNPIGQLVRDARPFWLWGDGPQTDFAYPDTAYHVYNTTSTQTYNITLNNSIITYSNGSAGCPGPQSPQTLSLPITVLSVVGINNETVNVKIYPNPTSDIINVNLENITASVSLYNLQGQKVYEISKAQGNVKIPVANLPTGTYILNVDTGKDIARTKINISR